MESGLTEGVRSVRRLHEAKQRHLVWFMPVQKKKACGQSSLVPHQVQLRRVRFYPSDIHNSEVKPWEDPPHVPDLPRKVILEGPGAFHCS